MKDISDFSPNSKWLVEDYVIHFFDDFSLKKETKYNTSLVLNFMSWYNCYGFQILLEDDDKIEKIREMMYGFVNEYRKDSNEKFGIPDFNPKEYEKEILEDLDALFDKELIPFNECSTKNTIKNATLRFSTINFPMAFSDEKSISNYLFNYVLTELIRKHVYDNVKEEDVFVDFEKMKRTPNVITNISKYILKSRLSLDKYNKLSKKIIQCDSHLFYNWFFIKKDNFYFKSKSVVLNIEELTSDEVEILLQNCKSNDGYLIHDAEYTREEAIVEIRKQYRKVNLLVNFDYYYGGLHITNKIV